MHIPSEQHIINSITNTALVTVSQGRVMFDFLTTVVSFTHCSADPSCQASFTQTQDRKLSTV